MPLNEVRGSRAAASPTLTMNVCTYVVYITLSQNACVIYGGKLNLKSKGWHKRKAPISEKGRKRANLGFHHNAGFSDSLEFWLLLLNSEWLRACIGQLCISINIKARICHIPSGCEDGGWGGVWKPSSNADGAQLTGG